MSDKFNHKDKTLLKGFSDTETKQQQTRTQPNDAMP